MNPDWEVMVHGPDCVLPSLQASFDAAKGWSSKSDLMRYSALWEHGGWYFDVDFLPMRPLDDLMSNLPLMEDRVIISRQQGHKSGDRLPFAATPLACSPHHTTMARMINEASDPSRAGSRVGFGPSLIRDQVRHHPHQFCIIPPEWFFPWSIAQMPIVIPHIVNGAAGRLLSNVNPIAVHMWADAVDIGASWGQNVAPSRKVAIVDSFHRLLAPLATGLKAAGYEVHAIAEPMEYASPARADLIIGWNDRKAAAKGWTGMAMAHGALMLYAEHGWFDRASSIQLDPQGIQHRASWARHPKGSHHPIPITKTAPRSEGYILVLGQVDGDSQIENADFPGVAPMLRRISRCLGGRLPIRFRPHPSAQRVNLNRFLGVHESPSLTTRGEYQTTKEGGAGLKADLAGARFAVSINSTALIDASIAGIPCMAFGPSLGLNAGAFRPATSATLPQDLDDMIRGWVPPDGAVDLMVGSLWSHQHSPSQLSSADYVMELVHDLASC